MISGMAGW